MENYGNQERKPPEEFRECVKEHFEEMDPDVDELPTIDSARIIGVLISHAHMDHVGHISLLVRNKDFKIVLDNISREILRARIDLMDILLCESPSNTLEEICKEIESQICYSSTY